MQREATFWKYMIVLAAWNESALIVKKDKINEMVNMPTSRIYLIETKTKMITAGKKRTQLLLILDNQSWLYFMGLEWFTL